MPDSLQKNHTSASTVKPSMMPIIGFFLGVSIWLLDAYVDVFILEEEQSLLENMFSPDESTELWMRSLVLVIFIIMGFFSRHLLNKHIELDNTLLKYQADLEQIIEERTQTLIQQTTELETLANTDSLTTMYNRRKFSEILELEIKRHQRYQKSFSLINIDIDHFKKVNDNYGHDTGDRVIEAFSHTLRSNIRETDSACRWGGEEFVLLIIEADINSVILIAEKIRKILNTTNIEPVGKVTASLGVTQVKDGDSCESIITRSDQALYKAKNNGRNRMELL